MAGAPSQLDLFDYKPKLVEYEGKPIPPEVIGGQRYAFIRPDAAVMGPRFKFKKAGRCGVELAEVLPHLARVADVACLGLPDDEMGERLVALVQRASGSDVDAETLSAWCRRALAGYKCPREFRFVTVIPRNAMGKIDKRALRSALPAEP